MSTATGDSPASAEPRRAVDGDLVAFIASLLFHLCLLLGLGLAPLLLERDPQLVTLTALDTSDIEEPELSVPEQFHIDQRPTPEIGANTGPASDMSFSAAEILSDISDVPSPVEVTPVEIARIEINHAVQVATGLHVDNLPVRGSAGEGTTGAVGAIDRITQDILLSLEERKTLVVWLFDQSGSLSRQRKQIRDRFERIYRELGVIEAAGNPAFKRHDSKPLLTSIIAFGNSIHFLTDKPTDDIEEMKDAIDRIEMDESGVERVFSAVYAAAARYRKYRRESPHRNVMFVVFTDEVGDDQGGLEKTIEACRRNEMPVYVVGVPAPLGREATQVKWVDPDPAYDQSPQWSPVNQGPESLLPERVKLRFFDGADPDPMDSGFGPFALTRLCYETGGIYFSVHPNRNVNRPVGRAETSPFSAHLKHFFDPYLMRKYRPDYVSAREYMQRINENRARGALIKAAQLSWVSQMEAPTRRFVKRSEADLSAALTEAQKVAARLEPKIGQIYETLVLGEADRDKEALPRWQAGYDLAMGRVLASKVRTEAYNAMLAKAKRGIEFKNSRNNTWFLEHSNEISLGSQMVRSANRATEYLERVVHEHPNTPWALLAQRELRTPLGWSWKERFTNLSPPRPRRTVASNNRPGPARDERPTMLKKPPPKRSPPRL